MPLLLVINFLILLTELQSVWTSTKFTKIECEAFDKPFLNFSRCELKVPKRNTIALYVHLDLYQVPVNNVSINMSLHKRANGYRPFMYNVTANFCEYLANKRRFPFIKMMFDMVSKYSNLNHTCPYNHDIIVDGLILSDEMFHLFPLPEGTYMYKLMVAIYNDWKAESRIHILRKE